MRRAMLVPVILTSITLSVFTQQKSMSGDLGSLVAAERSFAKASVERGVREAFLAFFADDGINFQPHPVNTKESFRSRPAATTPPMVTLTWEPVFGDVSAAGDLGYTTGPFWLRANPPEKKLLRQGYFFSIWKKQVDGGWKVVLDLGTTAPESVDLKAHAFQPASRSNLKRFRVISDLGAQRAGLIDADLEFLAASKSAGLRASFLARIGADSRIHRNGEMPMIGKEAIRSYLAGQNGSATWEPINADVARSNDLGYTYGRYEFRRSTRQTSAVETGYYVRMWKRDEKSGWKIAFDTTSPIPSTAGK